MRGFARARGAEQDVTVRFSAFSPAGDGGFAHRFDTYNFQRDLRTAPAFSSFLALVEQQCVPVGLSWFSPTDDHPQASIPDQQFVAEQNERWGVQWRGNFDFTAPSIELRAHTDVELSSHERLEARLQLRDWLQERVSPAQTASFLKRTLQ